MELPDVDVFYDSDGAGPCTQAPWDAFSSPREDELPDGSDCSEGGDAFPASPPGVASQAAFEGAEGLSDGGQLDETVSAADKRACELASLAESPEIGAAAGFRASSDEGCSINGTPPEMRRTGELDKQPGTQMVTPTEHLLEVERCIAQSVERVGAQDLPETPLLSSGVQDGAGATSALGEEEEPLCAELPTGELPLDSKRVGRRCGESLDGTIVAVSPIIEIGTASKPGHERTSFFLLELQLLESTAVSHRAAGQVATIGGACCAPGAQSRTGLPVQPLALGFCPPTSAEGILMPEPDQPTALISASRPAFVYIEGAARSKWREMCVAHAGQSVRVTGLKWRTMVVGSEGRERLVYVPGSDFGMDSGGRKGTVSGQSGGAECKGAEAANCGGECSSRGGGARHAAKGEGREGDNQHWGTWKGEERPPRKENALPSKQRDWRCGGGPSDGRQASDVREPMKGLPHDGTLCYVGVVSAVWSSGLVIELDRKLNLLLTHYPVTELPGLRVGSLLATWHVHPIPRGNRVLALGACTHSLVTVLGSPNPTGSETGLAGRGHLLRQLCDRLPFSVALWVVELERSLQVKLGGDSYRSKPAAAERVPSRLRSDVVGVEGPGKSRDGLRSLTEEEAARSKAPETAPVAVALRKGKAATSLKPSLQSLTGGPGELSPAGDSEGVSAPRTFPKGGNDCLSLVRDVLVHLLPGWKDLRQRRDVFGEFMSHDAECKLGVDPVGWKNPPKVPSIAALVGEVRKQGREPGRKVGQLSVDELGAALLGYLKVDADSGRAVLADATGSVRVGVQERLEAIHLGRWLLVTNFTADVSNLGPDSSEPFISFSLANALLATAPPPLALPHEKPLNRALKPLALLATNKKGTWLRSGSREVARTAAAQSLSIRRGAATWQGGEGAAGQPSNVRGNDGCTAAGGLKAGRTPFWMISIVSKSAIVRGERGPRFAAEAVLLPRGLTLLAAHNGALGGSSTSAQRSGFETGSDTISFGFRVPPNPPSRRRNPHQNPLLPKPHSGLVQSYYRAVANEMRETSGPPWLVPRAETTHGSVTPSDGCLFTPAWERRHRPVHTALTRPLGRCTGVPNQAAPRGASSRDRGTVSPERDGKGLLLPGAVLGVIPNPVSANRAWSNPPDGLAVRTGDQSSGPCPGNGATGQSRKSNTWSGHGAPGLGNRTVIGAAAAVRLADVRSPKRPKVSGTGVPVERAESAECLVYKRNLGATGRADQKLERDSPMSAVLEERAPIGRSGFAADSEARVLLTCAGEAALLHDLLHVGSTYLVPAPQSGPKPPHTSSTSTAPALPPPKFSQPRFPVIDLTDRESVHSFQLVTSKAGTGSENGETSERPVAESENGAQASLLVELREPVYREALPLLGARPPAQSTEYRASKLGEGTEAAETVRLRGRVVAVLELQLVWGCPFCGAQSPPTSDARTLRTGCVRCCADESHYTVLLRGACFSFDDGASQCEVWAEGSAAADLLCLPYVPANPVVCPPYAPADRLPANQNPSARAAIVPSKSNIAASVTSLANNRSLIQPSKQSSSTMRVSATGALDSTPTACLHDPSELHAASSPRQQAAAVTSSSAHGVKRLRTTNLDSAREALLESVKRRQRRGTSKAAQYEPATLFGHLHRCLVDPSKLEALVRREGLVRVRANPDGAADGSFQAARREMTGERTGQLSGPDREVLEVLLGNSSRQSQKVLTCARLPRPAADRSRYISKEQSEASRGGRCRVYLSGQVHEIHAPVVAAYRILKAEALSPSVEAAALCRQLTEDAVV